MKLRYKLSITICIILLLLSSGELWHTNQGRSSVVGSPGKGQLENAWLLPYSGDNFRFFSPLSYFILDRAYVDHRVYAAVVGAYASLEDTRPGQQWRIMECSRKRGGRMWPHRTHQSGMSVDFMVPKTKKGRQHRWLDRIGVWHYALSFDDAGNWNELIQIDFEAMGQHLLALDDAARANGISIKKVILKIDLKDEFYATPSGREVRRRGIYLAKSLPKLIDDLHDDHYHVDFK
ncbi:MAG: hypothetical protein AAGA31_19165 [Bacteroidota bacterium]